MSLVVDASALVALGLNEPERDLIERCILAEEDIRASSINLTEAGIALVIRFALFTADRYDEWLVDLGVQETSIDSGSALRAYQRYGKGIHRAGLNLGDCFAYALAKELDAPLLFKGDDFRWTDVKAALQPT